jgi:hypothetical protein
MKLTEDQAARRAAHLRANRARRFGSDIWMAFGLGTFAVCAFVLTYQPTPH